MHKVRNAKQVKTNQKKKDKQVAAQVAATVRQADKQTGIEADKHTIPLIHAPTSHAPLRHVATKRECPLPSVIQFNCVPRADACTRKCGKFYRTGNK